MMFRIQSFRQAAFWSTAINAFSQVLALVFSMAMAAVFGAQESTDVLYYCIGVFAILSGLLQAANVNVLIPETMRRRHQVGEHDAMAFINRFFAGFAVIILVLTAGLLVNPTGILTFISRFSPAVLARNSQLVFWLVASLPLQMAAQLLLDVLVSYKFLTLPALLSCVNRVINLAFVLMFYRPWGVLSVALGMLLGFGLQVLLNLYLLRHAIHWRLRVWRTRVGGQVYRNIAWTEAGTLASAVAGYLPLFLFSGFSAGALTALNYARRLSAVPTELLTTQVSGVIGIKFNELAARDQGPDLNEAFGRAARMMIFILTPLSFLLALTSTDVVSILYARGAFRGAAVEFTALLFALLVMSIPLTGMMTVMARYFVSRQVIFYGTAWQTFSAFLNAAMVIGWVKALGPVGLPIGLFLHMLTYLAVLSVSLVRRFPGLPVWPVWKAWLGTTVACLGVGLPIGYLRMRWGMTGHSPWIAATTTTAAFAAGYGIWLFLLPPDRMVWHYWLQICGRVGSRLRNWSRAKT